MISLPPKGNDAKELGSYFAPLKVTAQSTPNMTVAVAEGAFWTADNEHQEYIGGTSPIISAPTSDAKWVMITVTKNGALNVIDGVASPTPTLPDVSLYKDELPLAVLFVGDTVIAITNEMIYDIRALWQIPPDSVNQSQLNDFATIVQLNNGLATKAEIDGTNAETFTISVGTTSTNNSGFWIDRSAGPDVGIRFNETALSGSPGIPSPQWEFTNDGTTWNAIGVSSGNYYLKTELNTGAIDFRYYTQNELGTAGVLDTRYYEQTVADGTFSAQGHTHLSSEITDFPSAGYVESINGFTPVVGDVTLDLNRISDVNNAAPTDKHVLVWRTMFGEYRNDFLQTDDLIDVDTSSNTPVIGELLIYNGGSFVNRELIKNDISDFTGAEFVLTTNLAGDAYVPGDPSTWVDQDIYGLKTFKDGIVVEKSLVVTGTNTSIQTTDLKVTDPHIEINFGETGNGVGGGSGTSGIRVKRGVTTGSPVGTLPDAIFQWDESAEQWELGVEGLARPVVTGNHSHVVADITDFALGVSTQLGLNNLNIILDVTYLSAPADRDILLYDFATSQWVNRIFADEFTTELNTNNLEEVQDVSYIGVVNNDFLVWDTANSIWTNHVLIKADVTDFVETDYLHTDGTAEVKAGDLTINGNFTVGGGVGTTTTLNSENVFIRDSVINLNVGETGNGVGNGSGTAGIEIDRGPLYQNALFRWDESSGNWAITTGIGPTLITSAISVVGHSHLVADISDLSTTSSEINTLVGINTVFSVQAQLDDKISRQGDAMDNGANLTFAVSGEVLGLPATPSATAASSKEYVDTEVTRKIDRTGDVMDLNANLIFSGTGEVQGLPAIPLSNGSATSKIYVDTHIADMTLHLTAEQNTFLDGLALTGSPALTSADVNGLIGLGGTNIVTALATKTDKLTPGIDQNLAALDIVTGNIVDSGVVVDDGGLSVNEIWTANKINTTKTNKVFGVVQNNFVTWDIFGDILDSGLILNDAGNAVTDLWSADKIDNQKVDKVPTAAAGNIAIFDANGNIEDTLIAPTDFATLVHTHLASDITNYSTAFTTELALNNLQTLGDVSNNPPVSGAFLRWNGTIWDDIASASVIDFVRATGNINELVTGQKTFQDNTFFQNPVVFSQDVIINSDTAINGSLVISGDFTIQGSQALSENKILLNDGSTSAITANGGGVVLERDVGTGSPLTGNLDQAGLIWDEGNTQWLAGLSTDLQPIARVGVTSDQPDYQYETGTGTAVYVLGFGVPVPIGAKAAMQIFVNGIKQVETKAYTVNYTSPTSAVVTFIGGSPDSSIPLNGADVEFYGFGYIG